MDSVIVEFDQNDLELRNALADAFGDDFSIVESRNFDSGTANVIQAILPVVSALTPILVAYFARPKQMPATKRAVVTENGRVILSGYDAEDVDRLLKTGLRKPDK